MIIKLLPVNVRAARQTQWSLVVLLAHSGCAMAARAVGRSSHSANEIAEGWPFSRTRVGPGQLGGG